MGGTSSIRRANISKTRSKNDKITKVQKHHNHHHCKTNNRTPLEHLESLETLLKSIKSQPRTWNPYQHHRKTTNPKHPSTPNHPLCCASFSKPHCSAFSDSRDFPVSRSSAARPRPTMRGRKKLVPLGAKAGRLRWVGRLGVGVF